MKFDEVVECPNCGANASVSDTYCIICDYKLYEQLTSESISAKRWKKLNEFCKKVTSSAERASEVKKSKNK